jgi:putative NADPH-quinone reductase
MRAGQQERPVSKHILIIDGHPDSKADHYVHALSAAYRDGARSGGHQVRGIIVSELWFPVLRTSEDFKSGVPAESIRKAQEWLAWADHVVILFPLWLGSMPALLKAFFEQLLRPGFAFSTPRTGLFPQRQRLAGKSARVIVTMGMPAWFYRWYFRAHSLKSLKRNVLRSCGFAPVRACCVGAVESMSQGARGNWLSKIQRLGAQAR